MKTPRMILLATALCASCAWAGTPVISTPQPGPADDPDAWEFAAMFYVPMMGLEGDIGVGPISTTVDIPFGDILENLDGGLMVAFEARRNRWSITGDFVWLKLSASTNATANSRLALEEVEILGSLALGYEIFGNERTKVDFLAGAAVTSLDIDLELFTPRLPVPVRTGSGSQSWIDPFVGIRVYHRLSERWSVWARADYGGFGVSSDEYWQALAGVAYRFSDHASIALAYRVMAVDYQQGSFRYDTEMSGPNLGLVFRF